MTWYRKTWCRKSGVEIELQLDVLPIPPAMHDLETLLSNVKLVCFSFDRQGL